MACISGTLTITDTGCLFFKPGDNFDPVLANCMLSNIAGCGNALGICCIVNGDITANTICACDKLVVCSVYADLIASDQVITRHMAANSVTADKIDVSDLSSVNICTGCLQVSGCIYSQGYASGALGQGFMMCCNGYAEFQNVRLRGKLTASAFEKDTVSVVGGNLLVLDGDILDRDMSTVELIYLKCDDAAASTHVDDVMENYDGTATTNTVNIDATGHIGNGLELDGDAANINLGDVTELHDTETFSFAGWLKQDVLDVYDIIFIKYKDADEAIELYTQTDGLMYARIRNTTDFYGTFDYSAVVTAGTFFHIAVIVDLSQSTDAERIKIYINGAQQTLSFTGTAPAKTPVLTGSGFYLGSTSSSFDGVLDDIRVFDSAITEANVLSLYNGGTGLTYSLGESITISGDTTFAADDVLRIKDGDDDEWLTVTGIANAPTYDVARDKASDYTQATVPLWKKGTAVANYGESGEGYIFMTASEANSPYISMGTHAGSPWDTVTNRVRLGNLDGIGGVSGYGLWSDNVYLTGKLQSANYAEGSCGYCLGNDGLRLYGDNGEIVGASVKTAASGARTEMTPLGFAAYSDDDACYSCWNGANLMFKTCYDEINYLKRHASGATTAGCTVTLCRWEQEPDIIVGIQSLRSYDCGSAGCQRWCVYYDNVTQYNNGTSDYGYTFDVHAELVVDNASCCCDTSFALGACRLTPGATCSVQLLTCLEAWCHPGGDCYFYYGVVCYEVCYRCNGCGTWQGSCTYTYTQGHANKGDLQTACNHCATLNLPSCECWELMVCETGTSYTISNICGTSTCCCCRTIGTQATCCVVVYCEGMTPDVLYTDNDDCFITVSGSSPSNIFCTYVCLCHRTIDSHPLNIGTWGNYEQAACWCAVNELYMGSCQFFSCAATWSDTCLYESYTCFDLDCLNGTGITTLCMCSCVQGCATGGTVNINYKAGQCICSGFVIQCWGEQEPLATCCYRCIDAICSTLGTQVTLDSSGTVSYLAVAYA